MQLVGIIGAAGAKFKDILIEETQLDRVEILDPIQGVGPPVCGHSDIACCPAGRELIGAPQVIEGIGPGRADGLAFMRGGQTRLTLKYPGDIAYNVLLLGRFAVHNTKHTDPILRVALDACGYRWIHVEQGYSNCVCLSVGEGGAVTGDRGMARVLRTHGIKVLEIGMGHIDLPGFDYGFIGGAAAQIGTDIIFFGDLHTHPEGGQIAAFIAEQGCTVKCLGDSRLLDIGSVRVLEGT